MTCDIPTIQRGFDLLTFMGLCVSLGVCLARIRSMRRRVWAIGERVIIMEGEIRELKSQHAHHAHH